MNILILDDSTDTIQSFADALFMPWVVGVLLGAGLFLTHASSVRAGASICRCVPRRRSCGSASGAEGALTPFQAFMTALAASIGTGNIAGVATAIVSGGPGALFWIWVYGFVAMAIKFSEAVLGITFRETRAARPSCPGRCITCATACDRRGSRGPSRWSPRSRR